MGRITSLLNIGGRSLMNSQTALQTVSHNIANKSTEGYSRQRVDFHASEPIGQGKLRMGTGATPAVVSRTSDEFLERQIGNETNRLGFAKSRADNLGRVEQIYNEQINRGLNHFMGEFFNSFRELSNNPESQATRSLVQESAANLGRDFKRIHDSLRNIQYDIDNQINADVEVVNGMASEIASLNEKIQFLTMSGSPANDERDRRELLVKKLGEKVNIHTSESTSGMLNITAGNSAVLVSGGEAATLKTTATGENGIKREGNVDIIYKLTPDSAPIVMTREFTGGTIGGALDVRDNVVTDLLDRTDTIAFTLANQVNEAHRLGYNRLGTTGIDFFGPLQNVRDAAANMGLSTEVKKDVNKIAAGILADSPADNRVAMVISNLQNHHILENGTTSLDDYYQGMVGRLAVVTKKSNDIADHQHDVVEQLKNVRESISGVNLDEEAIKMIEFQKHFDASAKMIKVADQMFDTVLGMLR